MQDYDRTRSHSIVPVESHDWVNATEPKGPFRTGPNETAAITVTEYDSRVSSKSSTPHYGSATAHPLPVNPYSLELSVGPGYVSYQWAMTRASPTTTFNFRGRTVAGFAIPTMAQVKALYPLQKEIALNDAKARFAQHISNVEWTSLQDIGEARETADLLVDTAKRMKSFISLFSIRSSKSRRELIRLLRQIQRSPNRNSKLIKNAAVTANSIFLEYQFGWKPLFGSFHDIANVLHEHLAGGPRPRSKVKGIGSFSNTVFENTLDQTLFISPITMNVQLARVYECSYVIGGLLKPDQQATTFSQRVGFTKEDIIPTVWEVARLSFIADYVANIGDVISNLKQAPTRMQPSTLYLNERIVYTTMATGVVNNLTPAVDGINVYTPGELKLLDPVVHTMTSFSRSPIALGKTYVDFNLRVPSGDQVFKSLSVAFSILSGQKVKF